MSHDQKPPRVRVVNGSTAPAQRRDDEPPGAGSVKPRAAGRTTPAPPPRRGGAMLVPVGLFLAGSAIGGAALALLVRA